MRITAQDNPETIKRYSHIKPARAKRSKLCWAGCPGTPHTCTLLSGHRGPHVSHGSFRRVQAVWDAGSTPAPTVQKAPAAPRMARRPRRRRKDEPGLVVRVARGFLRLVSDIETFALLAMFIAFTYFAIDWLLLIMR